MNPVAPQVPRVLLAMALLFVSSACAPDAESPTAPETLPPLTAATWHLVEADGQALPAVIAHRLLPGNVLEQSVLESATLRIESNGTYEQLYRIRTLANGVQQSNVLVQDIGAWTAGSERYDLASDTRVRDFRIDPVSGETLSTIEQMVFRQDAGLVRGVYALTSSSASGTSAMAASPVRKP